VHRLREVAVATQMPTMLYRHRQTYPQDDPETDDRLQVERVPQKWVAQALLKLEYNRRLHHRQQCADQLRLEHRLAIQVVVADVTQLAQQQRQRQALVEVQLQPVLAHWGQQRQHEMRNLIRTNGSHISLWNEGS
jgi:hypothetical protein